MAKFPQISVKISYLDLVERRKPSELADLRRQAHDLLVREILLRVGDVRGLEANVENVAVAGAAPRHVGVRSALAHLQS